MRGDTITQNLGNPYYDHKTLINESTTGADASVEALKLYHMHEAYCYSLVAYLLY